jgi:hypothetical protein
MKLKANLTINNLILTAILLLALFLRTYKLATVPPHLTVDEAALGYNAYSILKTARDEYGQFLPLVFKSFSDYKPGLYIYAAVPFIAALGLNEFAVRLPSALAGVTAVWLIYLLTQQLISQSSNEKSNLPLFAGSTSGRNPVGAEPDKGGGAPMGRKLVTGPANVIALTSSFLLAINPWHLHFSRGAWEANLSLTLTLAGIYCFFKAINYPRLKTTPGVAHDKPLINKGDSPGVNNPGLLFLTLSAVFFGLTFYTYQSAKLFTPLIVLGLVIFFGKSTWQQFKFKSLIPPTILGFLFLPILIGILTDTSGRLKVFSAFSYTRPPEEIQTLILDQDHITQDSLIFTLFHSEAYNHLRTLIGHYFNYFSGRFLLFEGDWTHPAHHAPYYGYLYWLDLIALLAAIHLISHRLKTHNSQLNFLLYWLAVSPLPAVLSRDQVHAIRSYNLVAPLIILLALGWTILIRKAQTLKKTYKLPLYTLFIILYSLNLAYYLDLYYTHFPLAASQDFQYGYRQLVLATQPYIQNHQPVVVSQSYAQPYIFFLFYLQYPPDVYQAQARLSSSPTSAYGDVGFVEKIDNITFRSINWSVDQKQVGAVFAADPVTTIHPEESSDPDRFKLVTQINYLNGTPAFRVIEVL